jgi:ParB-like nuclease domain
MRDTDGTPAPGAQDVFDWRAVLPVHPLAAAYQKIPHDRLVAIGENIRRTGLQHPILVHAKGDPANPDSYELLDGVNRLNALVAAGIKFEFERLRIRDALMLRLVIHDTADAPDVMSTTKIVYNLDEAEIADKIESANLHRRHLEPEQYRARIEASHARIKAALEREPEKSNRVIAEETGASEATVRRVRNSGASGDAPEKRTGKDGKTYSTGTRCAPKMTPEEARAKAEAETLPTLTIGDVEQRARSLGGKLVITLGNAKGFGLIFGEQAWGQLSLEKASAKLDEIEREIGQAKAETTTAGNGVDAPASVKPDEPEEKEKPPRRAKGIGWAVPKTRTTTGNADDDPQDSADERMADNAKLNEPEPKPEPEKPAPSCSANDMDIAAERFDALALELIRITKGRKPQQFAKTAVALPLLGDLAHFLRELVSVCKLSTDAPAGAAE